MAKVEGMHLRGSRWYVRILVPKDLQTAFGRSRLDLSLGTSDRREATLQATLKRAHWLATFDTKRGELSPAAVDAVTPELAQHLALRVRARVLMEDDDLRQDHRLLSEVAHVLGLDPAAPRIFEPIESLPPRDALEGLTDSEYAALVRMNAGSAKSAAAAVARRKLSAVLPLVEREARELGLAITTDTPGILEALPVCLAAFSEAWQEVQARDAGKPVPTPAIPPAPLAPKAAPKTTARTLRDVYDRWKLSGATARSADSIAAYGRAVTQFEGQHPALPLEAFNGDLGDAYRAWLVATCKTPKTARDRLTAIKSLLKFATDTLEWLPKQPWRGLDIKATTTHKRRPWSAEELAALFGTTLHQRGTLPEHPYAGGMAAYWVPLLGLFTGARLGELCQLRTVDVQMVGGLPALVLTDDGEEQSIKSEAGHRTVPIHSELLRLGFLEYVETIRATGKDSLWPAMKLRKGKPSDYFGRWFKEHREGLGLTPSFHYFRHTVRPLMRQAGIPEETQDKVTGHASKGSVGTVVYGHWALSEVRDAVEAIRYPSLVLPKVSP